LRQSLDNEKPAKLNLTGWQSIFIASLSEISFAIYKKISSCYFYQKSSFIYPLKHLKFTINAIFDNDTKVFIQKSKFIT